MKKINVRLVVLTLVFTGVAGYLIYQRFFPPFSTDRDLKLEPRSAVVPALHWPHRKMRVTLTVRASGPVDVYVVDGSDRQDQQIAKSDGKEALEGGRVSTQVLASQQKVESDKIVFDKPEYLRFAVLVVNPSQKEADVRIELSGR